MWPDRKINMRFNIEIGGIKKHRIEYEFNQLLGRLIIKLDRKEIERNDRFFGKPVKQTHVIQVDPEERVAVRIERKRRSLFGCKCLVYLNERLFECYEGI